MFGLARCLSTTNRELDSLIHILYMYGSVANFFTSFPCII